MKLPYYYSRLSKSEKAVYDRIYQGLCSYGAGMDLGMISRKKAFGIYTAVLNDHPEISIVDCTAVNTISGMTNLRLVPVYWFDEKEVGQNHMKFLRECEFIVNKIADSSMTDFEKEMAAHDFICRNISYGYCNVPGMEQKLSQSAFSTLFERRGMCRGISMLFKCLMDLMGVETIVAEGQALGDGGWEEHAWNLVRLDGAYTHADLTYDIVAGRSCGMISFFRTNFTDEEGAGCYRWDHDMLPVCNTAVNGYYERKNLVAADGAQLQNIVRRMLAQGTKKFSFKILRGSELSCRTEDRIGEDVAEYAARYLNGPVQVSFLCEESMKRMLVEIL